MVAYIKVTKKAYLRKVQIYTITILH